MNLIIRWLVFTLAILITAYLLPGVEVNTFFTAFVTALVLGLVNTFIKPIIVILTLPLNILSLGLFTLVINALLIMLVGRIVPDFFVDGFLWALLFSIILTIINWALSLIFNSEN